MILEDKTENAETNNVGIKDHEEVEPIISSTESEKLVEEDTPNIEDISEDNTHLGEEDSKLQEKPKNPKAKWYILQAYSGYEGRVEQTIKESAILQ